VIKWNDELLGKQVTPQPGWIVTDGRRYGELRNITYMGPDTKLSVVWAGYGAARVFERDAHSPVYPPNGWSDADDVWKAITVPNLRRHDANTYYVWDEVGGDFTVEVRIEDGVPEVYTGTGSHYPNLDHIQDVPGLITALQNAHMLAEHIKEGRE